MTISGRTSAISPTKVPGFSDCDHYDMAGRDIVVDEGDDHLKGFGDIQEVRLLRRQRLVARAASRIGL